MFRKLYHPFTEVECFFRANHERNTRSSGCPGWLSKLLTAPVNGLENFAELFQKLTSPNGAIKVFCQVAEI